MVMKRRRPPVSVAVGVARLMIAPVGHAVTVAVPVVAVGHTIAVPVTAGAAPAIGRGVVAVGNAVAIAVPVAVIGNAVVVAVPAAGPHMPPAALLHPGGSVVAVAGACLDPVAVDPDMVAAAPLPMARNPHHP